MSSTGTPKARDLQGGGGRYSERYIERRKEQHIQCCGERCYESYNNAH